MNNDPLAPVERLLREVLFDADASEREYEAVRLLLDVARYAAMEHPTLDDLLAFARGLEEK